MAKYLGGRYPKKREDVWDKVAVAHPGECWLFLASTTTKGYGTFTANRTRYVAHRLTYELLRGPVPDGLVLDHACRVKRCVNPFHLQPVTSRENSLRDTTTLAAINAAKTECPAGHPYEPPHVRFDKNGGRSCRTCARERAQVSRLSRLSA